MTSIKVKECSSCGQGFDEDNNSIGKPIPTKKCAGGIHNGPIVLCTIISPVRLGMHRPNVVAITMVSQRRSPSTSRKKKRKASCKQLYDERVLSTTQVFNSNVDFDAVLQHVHTAFLRMSQVHLHHDRTLGVPRCLFQECKASAGGGRGSSGKVWLTCTVSKNLSLCVLKFHNNDSTGVKLRKEKQKWDLVYPEFEIVTTVDFWSGSFALKMPHFCSIPFASRGAFLYLIENMMGKKFFERRLVHCDVKWRNIGFYAGKDGSKDQVPVLYDLESVRNYAHEKDEHWIQNAMIQLGE
eukprot:gene31254-40622_t